VTPITIGCSLDVVLNAKMAYAWGHAAHDTGNEVRIVTVLGVPPVDSPRKAVQVSIVTESKGEQVQCSFSS